ncbi:DNA-binding protein [Nocardia cyriacigeorgica]|uniref:DNA-binding protein n=1 Tax=Nocardia cyriacigeorgica TaxID=135487 RepID=UPI001892F6F2|nr:DNA-binding protein [Nocardia cyriacigeorgica]MBF6286918.1 DNA-binding protein [Nocardia cyriacigeorgica]
MNPTTHLTGSQLGERWGLPTQTLAQWRYLGKGPNYLKLGKKVVYPLSSVLEFERANTVACSGAA